LRWRLLEMIRDRKPIEAALVREAPEASHFIQRPAEVADLDPEPSSRTPSMAWVKPPVGPSGAQVPPERPS
jgi:hypothetical protein